MRELLRFHRGFLALWLWHGPRPRHIRTIFYPAKPPTKSAINFPIASNPKFRIPNYEFRIVFCLNNVIICG